MFLLGCLAVSVPLCVGLYVVVSAWAWRCGESFESGDLCQCNCPGPSLVGLEACFVRCVRDNLFCWA